MNGFRIKRKQPIIQPWFDVANSQQTVRARILIIDEDQDTHREFHQALANDFHTAQYHAGEVVAFQPSFKPSFTMGYDLEHALTASEGVAKIKKSLALGYFFQVAFVGIRMLGMGSAEPLVRLWEIDPLMQIVIVTNHAEGSCADLSRCLSETDKFLLLKKPFERIEAVLMAGTLAEKSFLGRRAQALERRELQREESQPIGRLLPGVDPSDRIFVAGPFSNSLSHVHSEDSPRAQRGFNQRGPKEPSPLPGGLANNQAGALFLRRTIEAVERHMADCDFDVNALAQTLFISRRQLLRKVKVVAGCAPNVLIRRLRVKRAAELLKHSGSRVSEITYAVGFSDLKHFRAVFREQYGVCPGDYARKGEGHSKIPANFDCPA